METASTTRVPSPTEQVAETARTDNVPVVHRTQQQALTDTAEPAESIGGAITAIKEAITGYGGLTGAIANVMADIQAVEKGGKNVFHDYKYARMQDILTALTPLMGKHGIVIFQTEHHRMMFEDNAVLSIQYEFTIAHRSGEIWPQRPLQTGVSKCRNRKDGFDDKAWNKCHTAARKYFLLALFQIPTEDEDADAGPKQGRTSAPVPGPTGHMPPHRIDPERNEKFDGWAARYLKIIALAKTPDELVQWDNVNDDLLTQLSNGNPDLYANVLKTVSELQAKFAAEANKATAGPNAATETAATTMDQQTTQTAATKPMRPDGYPDPTKEPEAFLVFCDKRMARINDAGELHLVFEKEIDPATDGIMQPDYQELQAMFKRHEQRLEK